MTRIAYPLGALALVLLLWEAIARALGVPSLPTVGAVASEIAENFSLYANNTAITFLEGATGLVFAITGGFVIALVLATSNVARQALMPFVIAAQSIPLLAIAPLLAMWFGEGFFAKVLVAALLCWFPTAINASRGMLLVDPVHEAVFRVAGASKSMTLTQLRIPNSIAFLHSGIRISAGLAMIGAIIAEYGPVGSGIGQLVFSESLADPRNHARMFAATLFAAGAGFLLAELANLLFLRLFAKYMPQAR